ncbi:MAG: TAXI family TRAP transporter solute-binding subunit [Lysinibacillus sp.]
MKWKAWLVVSVLSCLILSACGSSAASTEKDKNGDYNIIMTTAGTSGTFYAVGAAIAQNLNNNAEGIQITNQASGGSVENIRLLDRQEVHFAIVGGDSATGAYNGTHEFEGDPKNDMIRGVLGMYSQPLSLVVLEKSGIESFSDLKGKRVAVGAPGSGSELKSREVLEVLGLPYDTGVKQQYLSFADAVEGMKDNQIDAAFIWAGVPAPAVQELGSARDIKLIHFTEEEVEKVSETNPSIFGHVIKGGLYKQEKEDFLTLAINTQIVTRADIPDDLVYTFMKGFFENLEEIQVAHESLNEISLEKADKEIVEIHPGAKKYYDEVRATAGK